MNKINFLNLANDLRAVAHDLEEIAGSTEGTDTSSTQDAIKKTEPEKEIRLEDVRAVLSAKSRDGYGAQVRKLIKAHGGNKLSEIDPAEYGAIMKEAEVFGHAT